MTRPSRACRVMMIRGMMGLSVQIEIQNVSNWDHMYHGLSAPLGRVLSLLYS